MNTSPKIRHIGDVQGEVPARARTAATIPGPLTSISQVSALGKTRMAVVTPAANSTTAPATKGTT